MRSTLLLLLAVFAGCTTYEDLGDHYAGASDWDRAHANYQRAWSEDSTNPILIEKLERARVGALAMHVESARAARASDNLDGAVKEFRQALRYEEREDLRAELAAVIAERDRRRAERALGQASEHLAARRLTAAERAVRRALELVPAHAEARRQLAAVGAAQQAVAPALAAAAAREAARDWRAAHAAYQAVLAGWADHPSAPAGLERSARQLAYAGLMQIGDGQATAGRFVEALDAFRKAQAAVDTQLVRQKIASVERRAAAQLAMRDAGGLLQRGALSGALGALQRAIELDPTNREARTLMATAFSRRQALLPLLARADGLLRDGRFDDAIAAYDAVLRGWTDSRGAIEGRNRAIAEIERADLIARAIAHAHAHRWHRAHRLFRKAHGIRSDRIVDGWLLRCNACIGIDALLADACACLDRHALTAACAKLDEAERIDALHPRIGPLRARHAHALASAQPILDRALRAHRFGRYHKAIVLYDRVLACWCDCAVAIDGRRRAVHRHR